MLCGEPLGASVAPATPRHPCGLFGRPVGRSAPLHSVWLAPRATERRPARTGDTSLTRSLTPLRVFGLFHLLADLGQEFVDRGLGLRYRRLRVGPFGNRRGLRFHGLALPALDLGKAGGKCCVASLLKCFPSFATLLGLCRTWAQRRSARKRQRLQCSPRAVA